MAKKKATPKKSATRSTSARKKSASGPKAANAPRKKAARKKAAGRAESDQLTSLQATVRDVQQQVGVLQGSFTRIGDEVRKLSARPVVDEADLRKLKIDLSNAGSTTSSHGRQMERLRSQMVTVQSLSVAAVLLGLYCLCAGAPEFSGRGPAEDSTQTAGDPEVIQVGVPLALELSDGPGGDEGEAENLDVELVQLDGTITVGSKGELKLPVAGLTLELARRLVQAHMRMEQPQATVRVRRATDEEVSGWQSSPECDAGGDGGGKDEGG